MAIYDKIVSVGSAVFLAVLLLSIYLRDPADDLQSRLISVINGLIEVEDQHVKVSPRVAVGYGACVDLYVDGRNYLPFNEFASTPQHFDEIASWEQLYKSYAYYFRYGAASE